MSADPGEIMKYIQEWLNHHWKRRGIKKIEVSPDTNLLESGAIDSLSFLALVGAIEVRFSVEIDFGRIEPGGLSTMRGLTAQCTRVKP